MDVHCANLNEDQNVHIYVCHCYSTNCIWYYNMTSIENGHLNNRFKSCINNMYKHFFRYDLYFQTNKGMLIKDSIVADDGETVITLNLKRGILSALQFPILEADKYDLAVEQVTHFTLKLFFAVNSRFWYPTTKNVFLLETCFLM